MNEEERQRFARELHRVTRVRYGNVKSAAYAAAKVNATTWDRLIAGMTVAPRTVTKVVDAFWPEAEGDWTLVLRGDVGAQSEAEPSSYVAAPGALTHGGVTNEDLLREIVRSRAELDQIRAEVTAVSKRMDKLEGEGP